MSWAYSLIFIAATFGTRPLCLPGKSISLPCAPSQIRSHLLGRRMFAAAEQWQNTFPGYGQGAQGYAKRYGAAYADEAISRMIGSAILPSLLHQDPRYFYRGSGSKKSRALYAISAAVICRGDNGRMQPNYSYVAGAFAAGGISNLYHPAGDRGAGLTIANGFLNVGAHASTIWCASSCSAN